MSSPFATYPAPERSFVPSNPASSSNANRIPATGTSTGAKRGRKPKTAGTATPSESPQAPALGQGELQWMNTGPGVGSAGFASSSSSGAVSSAVAPGSQQQGLSPSSQPQASSSSSAGAMAPPGSTTQYPVVAATAGEAAMATGATGVSSSRAGTAAPGVVGADEDGEGEDEMLPAMADDDYSAQLSWQSQSKENLKVLMDNFSQAQYDRFEAYRRHALPKQAVRKVIQQLVGQQVSQPVAQVVAGFAKVFVGEIIEKALAVQQRRGETGPLSPDHLREAYRSYQLETGRVGAARPLRGKRLFVR